MFYDTIDLAAGDLADALVFAFPSFSGTQAGPAIRKIDYSGSESFTISLFFAAGAAAANRDVVILDSAIVPVTLLAPVAANGNVGNRSLSCRFLAPHVNDATPMGLRATTSGKTSAARVRIAWEWWEEGEGGGL